MEAWSSILYLRDGVVVPPEDALCYLASPYTHADPYVREARFDAACRAAAALIRQGKVVFSPVCHSHPICRFGLPGDWQFWQGQDLKFLEMCNEVVVLKLDGWQQSVGVQAEIAKARALGKPVTFLSAKPDAVERLARKERFSRNSAGRPRRPRRPVCSRSGRATRTANRKKGPACGARGRRRGQRGRYTPIEKAS